MKIIGLEEVRKKRDSKLLAEKMFSGLVYRHLQDVDPLFRVIAKWQGSRGGDTEGLRHGIWVDVDFLFKRKKGTVKEFRTK